MSGYDDDGRDMTGGFDLETGSGSPGAASGSAVAQFIDDLRAVGDEEPPPPSPELAAVLAGTALPPRVRRPARRRVVAAAAACVLLGGAGVAAAHGQLPQPAQRMVSDVVDTLTPFTVPARLGSTPSGRSGPAQPAPRPVVGPGAGRHSDDERAGTGSSSSDPPEPRSGENSRGGEREQSTGGEAGTTEHGDGGGSGD